MKLSELKKEAYRLFVKNHLNEKSQAIDVEGFIDQMLNEVVDELKSSVQMEDEASRELFKKEIANFCL